MSVITGANLKTVADSIAKQKALIDAVIGTTATASTVLYGMQQNVTRINGYDEETIADCSTQAVNAKDEMDRYILRLNHPLIKALDSHTRRLADQGLSDYWEAENYPTSRWAPEFAQIARALNIYLKAETVFPPVTAMGSVAVTGAATGTFTDGSAIDGNLYGPADCELKVTAVGGASVSLVATVTGTDEDGNTVTGTATFSAAALNDTVDVTPDQAGKQFLDITTITFTGGASGDAFSIQSKVDRAVSL